MYGGISDSRLSHNLLCQRDTNKYLQKQSRYLTELELSKL